MAAACGLRQKPKRVGTLVLQGDDQRNSDETPLSFRLA
jgi:hypothetical protein